MSVLYLVSTPIGNLDDVTARAAATLDSASRVLAEDTRRTRVLLDHLGIAARVVSLHAHNESARSRDAVAWLDAGESLALVSDAGTPLVSDPGQRLARAVLDAGHDLVAIPGPSAALTALVASGLPTDRFAFLGFLARKGGDRTATLERIAATSDTTVLFESPRRLVRTLTDLADACGVDRRVAVGRELTKVHESFFRGTLEEARAYYEQSPPRGEVTLVVEGRPDAPDGGVASEPELIEWADTLLAAGLKSSRVAKVLAERFGVPRNAAYEIVQERTE